MTSYISLPRYLKTIDQRYGLKAGRCRSCGRVAFPPKSACPGCGGKTFDEERLSGRGRIHSYTIISRGGAPTEFDHQQKMTGEFAVALVELEEGPRIMGQMTDCDPHRTEIGMEVKATLRKLYEQEGVIRYGYKFRPQ
jgi:uncharacterized OB-fold protein